MRAKKSHAKHDALSRSISTYAAEVENEIVVDFDVPRAESVQKAYEGYSIRHQEYYKSYLFSIKESNGISNLFSLSWMHFG